MSILFTLKGDLDRRLYWRDRRRSTSFPNTAEITSWTYRFQKKGLTGKVAKAFCSTSSITMLEHSCTKNLLIAGAVICKLRGFGAKRQQMNNILNE